MKSFKQFLREAMTPSDALKVFGLKSGFTLKDLKTKKRKLASENHPDKGGSTEIMQKINVAYDVLKSRGGTGSNKIVDDDENSSYTDWWNEVAIGVRDDLVSKLDIDIYTKYFSDTFNETFTSEVTKIYPDDNEVERLQKLTRNATVYSVLYDVSFSNKDNTKVFNLKVSVSIHDIMGSSGLTSPTTTYPMSVQTFAYIDSRRVKITSRDYTRTNKNAVFTKPSTVFPKSKIAKKKKKAVVFKKSHMLAALSAELKAGNQYDETFYIKTADKNKYIGIYRNTFMRVGFWYIHGVYERNAKDTRFVPILTNKIKSSSFREDEEFLNILRKIQVLTLSQAKTFLSTEYDRRLAEAKAKNR